MRWRERERRYDRVSQNRRFASVNFGRLLREKETVHMLAHGGKARPTSVRAIADDPMIDRFGLT
jgi:hypothetical protein